MRGGPRVQLGAGLLAVATSLIAAPLPLPDFAIGDQLNPRDPQPEREVRWSGGGTVGITDVTYATYPGFRPLRLDLYRDATALAPRPLVVFVHGGGWAVANPRASSAFLDFPRVLAHLAQRGYVVASIQYRLSSEAAFPAQREDLREALHFLRENAARFGFDPTRVALWGTSAGAQIAALEAVSCGPSSPPTTSASRPHAACVAGFVGWFGPYDLETYATESKTSNVSTLLHCGHEPCRAAALREASPIRFVDAADPSVLLIHGTEDAQVPATQSARFAEALRTAGAPVQVLSIAGVKHGFIGPTPAATQDASRQALTATFEFLDRVLAPRDTSSDTVR